MNLRSFWLRGICINGDRIQPWHCGTGLSTWLFIKNRWFECIENTWLSNKCHCTVKLNWHLFYSNAASVPSNSDLRSSLDTQVGCELSSTSMPLLSRIIDLSQLNIVSSVTNATVLWNATCSTWIPQVCSQVSIFAPVSYSLGWLVNFTQTISSIK